jgi:hypothetical protein
MKRRGIYVDRSFPRIDPSELGPRPRPLSPTQRVFNRGEPAVSNRFNASRVVTHPASFNAAKIASSVFSIEQLSLVFNSILMCPPDPTARATSATCAGWADQPLLPLACHESNRWPMLMHGIIINHHRLTKTIIREHLQEACPSRPERHGR